MEIKGVTSRTHVHRLTRRLLEPVQECSFRADGAYDCFAVPADIQASLNVREVIAEALFGRFIVKRKQEGPPCGHRNAVLPDSSFDDLIGGTPCGERTWLEFPATDGLIVGY